MFRGRQAPSYDIRIGQVDGRSTIQYVSSYEKSFVWIVDKKNIEDFNDKINKQNCKLNGEKT